MRNTTRVRNTLPEICNIIRFRHSSHHHMDETEAGLQRPLYPRNNTKIQLLFLHLTALIFLFSLLIIMTDYYIHMYFLIF